MSKVQKLIDEIKKTSGGDEKKKKKTKNMDLCYRLIKELATDDDYVASYIESVKDSGELVVGKKKLAPEFRKVIQHVLEGGKFTSSEAEDIAKTIVLSKDDAKRLYDLVTTGIYLTVVDCDKKVQLFNAPDMSTVISTADVAETIRTNPRDNSKKVKIHARKKIKAATAIQMFQKEDI